MSVEVEANQIDYILAVKDDNDEDSSMLIKFKERSKPVVSINRKVAAKKFAEKIVTFGTSNTTAQSTHVKKASTQEEEDIDLINLEQEPYSLPVVESRHSPDNIVPNLNEGATGQSKEMDLS